MFTSGPVSSAGWATTYNPDVEWWKMQREANLQAEIMRKVSRLQQNQLVSIQAANKTKWVDEPILDEDQYTGWAKKNKNLWNRLKEWLYVEETEGDIIPTAEEV